jgi:hypothetical protein
LGFLDACATPWVPNGTRSNAQRDAVDVPPGHSRCPTETRLVPNGDGRWPNGTTPVSRWDTVGVQRDTVGVQRRHGRCPDAQSRFSRRHASVHVGTWGRSADDADGTPMKPVLYLLVCYRSLKCDRSKSSSTSLSSVSA